MVCKIEDLDHNPPTQKPRAGWFKAYFIANPNHINLEIESSFLFFFNLGPERNDTSLPLTQPMFEQVHVSVHRCISV